MVDPMPTADLNVQLRALVKRSRKVVWALITAEGVLLIAVAVLSGYLGWRQLSERQRVESVVTSMVSSQCSFYYSLGTAPLAPERTTKFGLNLVENSRVIVHRLGCRQKLPPPSAELIQLGRKYGVTITR
jgi:hypothetical protein